MSDIRLKRLHLLKATIIIARLLVGFTFIISGWSKAIDPWGFVFKIDDYLNVWGWEVAREISLTGAIALSCIEFLTGVLIATGCLRRLSVWFGALMMAFMLPLTVYIYVADPVSDCGCFGDFIVLSNAATLIKNIVLSALLVFLIMYGAKIKGIFSPYIQWLVIVVSLVYPFTLAFIGYRSQPLIDFRPYPVGTDFNALVNADTNDEQPVFVYTKEDREETFALDELPDSTWTFVRSVESDDMSAGMSWPAVYDGEEDISADIFTVDGEHMFLVVTDPGFHYLTRARLANEVADLMKKRGGHMDGLIAADGENLERWSELALPAFDVYSAEDTSLKELVRGDAALVFLRDGVIEWKRSLAAIEPDALTECDSTDEMIENLRPSDGERMHLEITLIYVLSMIVIYLLNFPPKILKSILNRKVSKKS